MLQAIIYLISPIMVISRNEPCAWAVAALAVLVIAWRGELPAPQIPFPVRVMCLFVAIGASLDVHWGLSALLLLAAMRSEIEFGAAEMEDAS
jgi:hypothetical protein